MGVASAALGVGAGLFGSGRKQQKKAVQQQEGAANRQVYENQQKLVRAEQERTTKQLQGAQAKINEGIARNNRRRIRGGIFGDADVKQGNGILNPRLG